MVSKALMTIHGYLTDNNDFGKLYDKLEGYDEVYKVELPGHCGEVDLDKFTVRATQAAVIDAYDALAAKCGTVDVVGFSLGGALATWLCALRKVHRAVLISPANKYFNVRMPFDAAKFYGTVTRDAYRSENGFRQKTRAVRRAWATLGENIRATGKVAWNRTLKYVDPHNYGVFCELIKQANMWVRSVRPQNPTLVLWGKLDELVPFKSVEFVREHFADVAVKVYPDVGHAMLYTNRDEAIIADITDFFNKGTVSNTEVDK